MACLGSEVAKGMFLNWRMPGLKVHLVKTILNRSRTKPGLLN